MAADRIEKAVIGDIGKLVSESPALIEAIEQANQSRTPELGELRRGAKVLRDRHNALDREADRYVAALGQGRLSALRLEAALSVVEDQKVELQSRLNEIEARIDETDLEEFDACLIRANLGRFSATFDMLSDEENPECLRLILKDVVLGKNTVQLNIFDLPEFNYTESSKKRSEGLLR